LSKKPVEAEHKQERIEVHREGMNGSGVVRPE